MLFKMNFTVLKALAEETVSPAVNAGLGKVKVGYVEYARTL